MTENQTVTLLMQIGTGRVPSSHWATSGGEQAAACPCSLYVLNTGWLLGGWGFTFPTSWAVHVWAANTRLLSEQRGISILSAHVLVIWRIRQSCWWYWFTVLKELSLHPFLCFYLGISSNFLVSVRRLCFLTMTSLQVKFLYLLIFQRHVSKFSKKSALNLPEMCFYCIFNCRIVCSIIIKYFIIN